MRYMKIHSTKKVERKMTAGKTKKKSTYPWWKELLLLLGKLAGIGIFFLFLFTIILGILRVADEDMLPSVKEGDLAIYNRLDKDYVFGDCIALEYEGKLQVRRVAAVGGDTVDITEDGLEVNGYLQQENLIYEETQRYADGIDFPVQINDDEIFVLGDARENATDSRIYGVVNTKDTKGKIMLIIRKRNF